MMLQRTMMRLPLRRSRPLVQQQRKPAAAVAAGRRCASSGGSNSGGTTGFWAWTTLPRPHWKECKTEAAIVFTVFGVTGTTSVAAVRPTLKHTIGLDGTMVDGPWSYRIGSILLVRLPHAGHTIRCHNASQRLCCAHHNDRGAHQLFLL